MGSVEKSAYLLLQQIHAHIYAPLHTIYMLNFRCEMDKYDHHINKYMKRVILYVNYAKATQFQGRS